jgi:hypothetical protein
MQCVKTEVYSWRLSAEIKADLERRARSRKVPVSRVLEEAVHQWLDNTGTDPAEEEEQRLLHQAVGPLLGSLAGDNPRRAENARETVRERIKRRHGR